MSYWAERQARIQEALTAKNVRQTEKQLKKYYERSMKSVIGQFELTYNKLLSTIEEGREPTPADLYHLDKYWQAQAQIRRELEALGDRQISLLSKQFELNFIFIIRLPFPARMLLTQLAQRQHIK